MGSLFVKTKMKKILVLMLALLLVSVSFAAAAMSFREKIPLGEIRESTVSCQAQYAYYNFKIINPDNLTTIIWENEPCPYEFIWNETWDMEGKYTYKTCDGYDCWNYSNGQSQDVYIEKKSYQEDIEYLEQENAQLREDLGELQNNFTDLHNKAKIWHNELKQILTKLVKTVRCLVENENNFVCGNEPPPSEDFRAYWKFDEGTGGTTVDETINGNDGSLIGGVSWTNDSVSGYALELNGVDGRINVARTGSIDLAENVTLSAWVKRQSNNDGAIIAKNGPYFLGIINNQVAGAVYADSGTGNAWKYAYGSTNLSQDEWYGLKMTYDGSTIDVYVNDTLDGSVTKTGPMPIVSQLVYLGWGEPPNFGFYFKGIIDELKIEGH